MKKMIILGLTLISFQSAFADLRGPGRPIAPVGPGRPSEPSRPSEPGRTEPGRTEPGRTEPGRNEPGRNEPGRNEPGRERLELPMCLKNLDNDERVISDLQAQLFQCKKDQDHGRNNPRETEDLKRENQRLNDSVLRMQDDNNRLANDNNRLINDNRDLRRQLEDIQNDRNGRTLGFFSYAGCKDFNGNIDLTKIISSEGRVVLEAETTAKQKLSAATTCFNGIVIGKTEEIRFTEAKNYCVAGCKDFNGNIDQSKIKSGTGRNVTEAQYTAIKEVTKAYTCFNGIKVQVCQ